MIAATRGEPAHQREELDLLAVDVDADDARHVVGIADEQHVLAEAVAVEDEPEEDRRSAPSTAPGSDICSIQAIASAPPNGRPTIHCQTELSSAPRSA